MKKAIVLGMILFMAGIAYADQTIDYGWEDGGTILSYYGNVVNPANVATGSDPGTNNETPSHVPALTVMPASGGGMLEVVENPHSGTPQAFIAFIENLSEGDQVTASFYGWDSTASASPSMRVWGHYALNGDIDSYQGSAGGNSDYTEGAENGQWSLVQYTWTIAAGMEALVIEARLYSTPSTSETNSTNYWIDDLQVIAPDTATVSVPGLSEPTPTPTPEPPTPTPNPTVTPTPNPTVTPTGEPCYHHGDCNLDGEVTAGDAQISFEITLGTYVPTSEEECAADCNGDGEVTAGDAQQIFMMVLGLDSCLDPL